MVAAHRSLPGAVKGIGGAPGAIPIALAPSGGIPLLGGTVWLDPGRIIVAPSIVLSGPAGVPGAGEASLPLAVPSNAALVGASLFFQSFILDPGAPGSLSMTEGFRVQLCR